MIVNFIQSMILYCLALFPLYIVIRFFIVRKRQIQYKKELLYSLFFLYVVAILSQTVVPSIHTREPFSSINLVPFRTISIYYAEIGGLIHTIAFYNLVGNIVLFVPFGIFLPAIWQKLNSFTIMLGVALIIPICIEFTQLFIGRSVDIDDVILNALGIFTGYVFYLIILKIKSVVVSEKLV